MALLQPFLLNTSTLHFTHKPRSSVHTKKPNPSVSILQPHHNQQLKTKFLSICAVATETAGGVLVEGDKSDDQDVVIDKNEGLGSLKDVVEYDWTQEWYPLYLTKNLPDDSPLGLTVFDKQVVLYKDGNGGLQCYEDRCPHRLAKLSEGQLVDGRLECLYHGWQFEGEGKCVKIPQLPKDAKIPRSACVKTYEVRDSQGVVWVWMSRTTPSNPEKIPWFEHFARPGFQDFSTTHELPYDHSILLENLMDPAHVPISHDRTDWSAKREDAQALKFKVTERTGRGFAGWWGKEKEDSLSNFLRFEAPCNLQNNREIVDEKTGEKNYFSGLFLCRPSGQGKSMLIVRFGTTKRSPVAKLFPEWYFHLNASKVFEQDMGFLSSQNEILMKAKVPTKEHFGHNTISLPKEPAVVEHAPAGLVASISASLPAKGGIGSMHAPNLANRYFRHVIHCNLQGM